MKVYDIVKKKGDEVTTLSSSASITDLLATLATHRIGAVVVVDEGQISGIVSERDVVRHLASSGTIEGDIASIMTRDVESCVMTDDVHALAEKMTKNRIRHLPVVQDRELVAIVSIGDVVKARLDDLQAERDHLAGFVHG